MGVKTLYVVKSIKMSTFQMRNLQETKFQGRSIEHRFSENTLKVAVFKVYVINETHKRGIIKSSQYELIESLAALHFLLG